MKILRVTGVETILEECQHHEATATTCIFRRVKLTPMVVCVPENYAPIVFEGLPLPDNVTYADGERSNSRVLLNGTWYELLQTLDEIEAQLKD